MALTAQTQLSRCRWVLGDLCPLGTSRRAPSLRLLLGIPRVNLAVNGVFAFNACPGRVCGAHALQAGCFGEVALRLTAAAMWAFLPGANSAVF